MNRTPSPFPDTHRPARMRRRWPGWSATVALMVVAGCASGPEREGRSLAAEALPMCTAQVSGAGEDEWRQVEANGFTFCVPGDWRAVGSRRWRGTTGWLEWRTGPVRPPRTEMAVVAVPADQVERLVLGNRHAERRSEMIGGGRAELWMNELQGRYVTGAQWIDPEEIQLHGEARSRESAERHLQIYRTVRFGLRGSQ